VGIDTEPAVGGLRCLVGQYEVVLVGDVVDLVGVRQHRQRLENLIDRIAGVRAEVVDEPDVESAHRSVVVDGHPHLILPIRGVHVPALKVLEPVFLELHGALELLARHGRQTAVAVDPDLRPVAAADVGGNVHPYVVGLVPQRLVDHVVDEGMQLDVTVDVEGVGLLVVGSDGTGRLEWDARDASPRVLSLDDVIGVLERRIRVAELEAFVVDDVRADGFVEYDLVFAGGHPVSDRVHGLVLDVHQIGDILRGVSVGRDDGDDRFPDEPDLLVGQRPLGECGRFAVFTRRDAADTGRHRVVLTLDILGGEDEFAVQVGLGLLGVDGDDFGVGVHAAHQRHVQAVLRRDVVDVLGFARQNAVVLDSREPLPRERLAARVRFGVGVGFGRV